MKKKQNLQRKPVAKKKLVPKIPSLIVKDETLYSIPWKPVKITANNIVAIEPYKAPFLFPWIKEWWAYVTVTKSQNNRLFMLLSM